MNNYSSTTRRDFVKLLGVLGLAVQADGTLAVAATQDEIHLREPELTGTLTSDQKVTLWGLFQHIGKAWGNASDCTLSQQSFEAIIDLKTSRMPSYLAEYHHALNRFKELCRDADETTVLERLYFEKTEPRLHRYVLAEFIHLQLAHGGFRFLGYRNFKGFMGGMFSDRARLPYRTSEDT